MIRYIHIKSGIMRRCYHFEPLGTTEGRRDKSADPSGVSLDCPKRPDRGKTAIAALRTL